MSISSEITRISGNVSDALTAIAQKGVTVPSGSNSDDLATLIGLIGGSAVTVTETTDTSGGIVKNITAVDISDTTAVASDVASGKYFYTADGTKTAGTASGGGTTTWETLLNATEAIVSSSPNYIWVDNYTEPFSAGETYRVTWGSDTYTCQTLNDTNNMTYDGYYIGDMEAAGYSSTGNHEPFMIYRYKNSTNVLIALTQQSAGSIFLKIEKQVSSGGNYQAKTGINPTTSSQTIEPDSGYDALSSVQINAMPNGTAGTPTASKGSVSNYSVSVTPSVTNTTGYITGGTKTGTAVTVSASELVSGTYTVDSSGTKDVTNYASASVPAGTAGTPSATKGTVSNHSISVTPSVTNTTGWITGSTKTGTAVTVSASELVSGSETKTANGTYDVTNLASLVVNVPIVTYYTGSSAPSASQGSNGDIYLQTS